MPTLNRSSNLASRTPRFSLPAGIAQINVQLQFLSDRPIEPIMGRLWDVSPQGCCVALPGLRQIKVPSRACLQLREPMTHLLHRLEAELRWCSPLPHSTFVGLLFKAGPLPAETFLASYMRSSWTDAMPISRGTRV